HLRQQNAQHFSVSVRCRGALQAILPTSFSQWACSTHLVRQPRASSRISYPAAFPHTCSGVWPMKYLRAALLACALSLVLMALTAAQSGIRPTLSYSTYLSGNDRTMILASTADLNGYQYATGVTTAADFPTTSGAYRSTPSTVNSCSVKDTCSYQ